MFQHIFHDEPMFEPFSQSDLQMVEQTLGVKLPEDYVALMKVHNGGNLAYNMLRYGDGPDDEEYFPNIYGIDAEEGIIESPYLVEEWEIEKGLVLFSGEGHYWLAFDYRETTTNPAVIYIDQEYEYFLKVADSFTALVAKLTLPEPDEEDDDEDAEFPFEREDMTEQQLTQYVLDGIEAQYIFNGFYQFARENCDMTWYISTALTALKNPASEQVPRRIVKEVLVKLKGTSYKKWPFPLLMEFISVLAQCDDDVALAYVPKLQAEVEKYKK